LLTIALVAGCSPQPSPAREPTDTTALARASAPAPDDSAAMLVWFERQAAAIDTDTLRLARSARPLALGAGAAGTMTAWRDGRIWTRAHVETRGAGFQSADTYWLRNGVLLGARLSLLRPGRKPAVDRIWFRDRTLYRWTNASGERLNPAARSTQYELRTFRARYDSLFALLDADDRSHRPAR
jgi:hypothetical protein